MKQNVVWVIIGMKNWYEISPRGLLNGVNTQNTRTSTVTLLIAAPPAGVSKWCTVVKRKPAHAELITAAADHY